MVRTIEMAAPGERHLPPVPHHLGSGSRGQSRTAVAPPLPPTRKPHHVHHHHHQQAQALAGSFPSYPHQQDPQTGPDTEEIHAKTVKSVKYKKPLQPGTILYIVQL